MLFRFCRMLVRTFMRIIFRAEVTGLENLPPEGGAMLCLNHTSLWDVPFAMSLLPRRPRFMAKKELFHIPFLRQLLNWTGAFPVARGSSDVHAIKTALQILEDGHIMAIFPEGQRVLPSDKPVRPKAGAGMIAARAGCLVIPAGISGRGYRIFRKKTLTIGKPMQFSEGRTESREQFREITAQIMTEVHRLAGTLPESVH